MHSVVRPSVVYKSKTQSVPLKTSQSTVWEAGTYPTLWSVLILGMSRGVESQTAAWAGERVVRDDFTEVVTFRARL